MDSYGFGQRVVGSGAALVMNLMTSAALSDSPSSTSLSLALLLFTAELYKFKVMQS